jgi:hypothetical protein
MEHVVDTSSDLINGIKHSRRYLYELALSLVAYAFVLSLTLGIIINYPAGRFWRPVIALLPMIPAASVCWVVIRQLHRVDEMQRRLQFEALAFAFAGTALITFGYGFLENAGLPRLSMFAVWPLMAVLWIIGLVVNRRRYA